MRKRGVDPSHPPIIEDEVSFKPSRGWAEMRYQGALQTLLGLDFKISAECFRKPVLDFALVPVEKLGHPLEGISVENTAHIDMKFLGLELISRKDTMEVAGIMFGSDDIAVQSIYQRNGQQVYLTIVRHYLPEASAAVIASNQNSTFLVHYSFQSSPSCVQTRML